MSSEDRQTQSAQAADEILRRIALMDLPPGATFTERELAERIGMGRVPVREALLRLATTGLLQPRTGSGYTVAPITLHSARDVFEAWWFVESASLALAIRRGRAAALAQQLRELEPEDDDPAMLEFQFHVGLAVASANHHLVRGHPGVEVTRLLVLARQLGEPHPGCPPGAHERLIAALAEGDVGVVELARQAIDDVQHRVILALSTSAFLQEVNVGS